MTPRTRKLRLTRRKIDRAVLALEALLASELPTGPDFGPPGTTRQLVEQALWDAVQPLYHAVEDRP